MPSSLLLCSEPYPPSCTHGILSVPCYDADFPYPQHTPLCPWGASFLPSIDLRAPCWAATTEANPIPYRQAPLLHPEGLLKKWSHVLGSSALTFQDKRSGSPSPRCYATGVPGAGRLMLITVHLSFWARTSTPRVKYPQSSTPRVVHSQFIFLIFL